MLCCSPPTAEWGQAHCSAHVIIELLPELLIEEFSVKQQGSIITIMTVLWHDIINSVSVFLTHVLHKTISPFVVSPLSLLWLQNCVVVSFFDSDYKQIICLILAEVSAFVHVFVSLSLDHEQQSRNLCIFLWLNQWSCKIAPLHKFAETWLTICEMQLIRKYFYTRVKIKLIRG